MAQTESTQGRSWRGWIIGLVVLAALIALIVWLHGIFHSVVVVKTATVQYQDILSPVSTNGQVEPVDDFQAHAPFPTTVKKLDVTVGQKVATGQLLLSLDDADARRNVAAAQATLDSNQMALNNVQQGGSAEELLSARSDMSTARLQLQQAQNTLASLQGLQSKGAASANEVASAQQRVSEAQLRVNALQARKTGRYGSADVMTAQAQVAQARQSLAAAQTALQALDVRSPFAGTVYSIPVSQFNFVQTGDPLIFVADLDHIQVRAYFDEPDIGKLSVGQPVKIVWDARPNRVWHGHIQQAPTTIVNYRGTRNVGECVITIDDAKGDLLPNTNVTVTVTTSQRFHVLSIPREALHTDGAVNFVYVVADKHLHRAVVEVGAVNLTSVEITGGLKEGQLVALSATTDAALSDGLEVEAQPE